jgi:pimeloyl-ACP methyl ester carboxylesterase
MDKERRDEACYRRDEIAVRGPMRPFMPALLALPLLCAAAPEPLPRRASLGVALAPATEGARVEQVVPGAAGLGAKLRPGDVITGVDGAKVADPGALVQALSGRAAGEATTLAVLRDGRTLQLRGPLAPRPKELYRNGVADYGTVAFQGGRLRDILVTPPGGAKGPVVFLLQGYTCDSMESPGPDQSHHQLIEGLLARGISTYRMEKPQAGDSRGGPACADIDFATELAGFQAGYRALREGREIPPERIFLLGHSMGGVEAPLLAAAGPAPRGVAVYGTVVRNWADYMIDVVKYQDLHERGGDPADGEARGERLRPLIQAIFLEGASPADLARRDPQSAALLREGLEWDGGERLYGRRYTFWHGLSTTPLLSAWRDVTGSVLSVYGESDFSAINPEDHKLIAEAVNHYRPGAARFVLVPRTGHMMRLDGDRAEARARTESGQFNAELVTLFAEWIEAAMAAPAP